MSGNVLVWLVEGVGAQLNCGNLRGLFMCTVSELCLTDLYEADSVLLGAFMCICRYVGKGDSLCTQEQVYVVHKFSQ